MESASRTALKRRRWPWIVLAVLVVCAGAGWMIVERAVDVERYRPLAVAAIERATGLPASIGALDLDLLPTPHLKILDIRVGEDGFQASAPQASASVRVSALAQRRLEVASVRLEGLRITLPEDTAQIGERFREVREHMSSGSGGGTGPKVTVAGVSFAVDVGAIRALGAELFLGNATEPAYVFDVEMDNVLSASVPVRVSASPPWLGPDAELTAAIEIEPAAGPSLKGSVEVHRADLAALTGSSRLAGAQLDVTASVVATDLDRVGAEMTGRVSGGPPALAGRFSADAWWDNGSIIVNDIEWQSDAANAKADLTRTPDGLIACEIREASLTGSTVAALAAFPEASRFTLSADDDAVLRLKDVLVGTTEAQSWRFAQGRAEFAGFNLAVDGNEALRGISGEASVEEGTIRLARFEAAGVSLTGTLKPDLAGRAVAAEFAGRADVTPELLAAFQIPKAVQGIGGVAHIRRVAGTFSFDGGFPEDFVAEGAIADGHTVVAFPYLSGPVTFSNLNGNATYAGGVIRVTGLEGQGFTVDSGTFTPNFAAGTVETTMSGVLRLGEADVRQVLPLTGVREMDGVVQLKHISGTFGGEEGVSGLEIEATIEDGRVAGTISTYEDEISSVTGSVQLSKAVLDMALRGESARMGTIGVDGQYALDGRIWTGQVTCEVERMAALIARTPEQLPLLTALLAPYELSTFDVQVGFADAAGATIQAARLGEPKLEGRVVLSRTETGWQLQSADCSASVLLDSLAALLPETLKAEGFAAVGFRHKRKEATFVGYADLTACTFSVGDYLRKAPDDPLSLAVDGTVSDAGWLAHTATVRYGGIAAPFRLDGTRVYTDALDIDVAGLAGLMPEGTTARGRVRGSFNTAPLALALQLDQVAFALGPELVVDSVTGDIGYTDGQWSCRNLAVRGANSDFTVTGRIRQGVWQGQLNGQQVDLNALLAMRAAAGTKSEEAPAAPTGRFTSELGVNIARLLYRRGQIDDLRADVIMTPEAIRVPSFSCRPYTGSVSGAVDVFHARGEAPARVRARMTMQEADARIIDDCFFPEPRRFYGIVTGELTFEGPIGPAQEALKNANGGFSFTARNGSFGKLGFATKLLTLFRTTEILRLRLPALKDEGLSYDTCSGVLKMQDGVLRIEGVRMSRPSYGLEAQGVLDFARDASDLTVNLAFLQGVRGLIEYVPVIGSAASKVGGMRVHVTGSPWDPQTSIEPTKKAGDDARQTEDAVVTVIEDALGALLNR